jgi:hypothetical protein
MGIFLLVLETENITKKALKVNSGLLGCKASALLFEALLQSLLLWLSGNWESRELFA